MQVPGLGLSKDKAIRYESQVKVGKSLVTMHGNPGQVERAKTQLAGGKIKASEVVGAATAAA